MNMRGFARRHEVDILRKKTVAGMDGVGAALLRDL